MLLSFLWVVVARFLRLRALAVATVLACAACGPAANSPYPDAWVGGKVLFTSFQERPKYLDPVSAYNLNESPWVYGIYEPPLQYHYLRRPYQLVPRSLREMPEVEYLDAAGRRLPADASADRVATSVYTLRLLPGMRYQPHPALARDAQGRYVYHALTPQQVRGRYAVTDFPLEDAPGSGVASSTREVTAQDYVYQIKRLASPYVRTISPIYGLMSRQIVGLKELGDRLRVQRAAELAGRDPHDTFLPWHDLRQDAFEGASAPDEHTLQIRVNGRYPQFAYWLGMAFFAPVPWEADAFYEQRGMRENGLTLNLWPLGSGPFMLVEQGATRYVMRRNPNYHGDTYPSDGEPGDEQAGLLAAAGQRLPLLDAVVSTLEKEREPALDKFLQGYYDVPFIERNDAVFSLLKEQGDGTGRAQLLRERGVRIASRREPVNWYMAFNWLDPVVGRGDTPERQERNRKLRQALSIAWDWDEHRALFYDIYGESETAMGPIPPGVFGYRAGPLGVNPVTHVWRDGAARPRPLEDARRLLAEAGYPDGRDATTGRPLVLTYDANGVSPAYQARLDWQVKQAAKIGVQLEIRAADYNRFQQRVQKGAHQIILWGWFCDYPDPENFLFLLYGPQARSVNGGDNDANYDNPEYDRLFEIMKGLPDGPERQAVIDRMVAIAREDAIWMWGVFPGISAAYQPWLRNAKPSVPNQDRLKYLDVDAQQRVRLLHEWNQPRLWPVAALLLALALATVPVLRVLRRREARTARTALVWTARGGEGGR